MEVEWEAAHRAVVRLAAARAAHEHALGSALLRALRAMRVKNGEAGGAATARPRAGWGRSLLAPSCDTEPHSKNETPVG